MEPQGFLGVKAGKAASESRGETDSNGLANAQRCRPLTGHPAAARTSPPRPRATAWASGVHGPPHGRAEAEAIQSNVSWRQRQCRSPIEK